MSPSILSLSKKLKDLNSLEALRKKTGDAPASQNIFSKENEKRERMREALSDAKVLRQIRKGKGDRPILDSSTASPLPARRIRWPYAMRYAHILPLIY